MSGVLMVHRGYPPRGSGGSEIAAEALARGLAVSRPVTVLHPVDDASLDEGAVLESHRDGVRVLAVNRRRPRAAGFEAYREPVPEAFARLLREAPPDVMHVHSLDGLSTAMVFEARRLGVPVVITLHDFWPACPLGQLFDLGGHVCPGPTPTRCLGCVGGQVAAPPALRAAGRRLGLAGPAAAAAGALFARVAGSGARRVEARLQTMREVIRAADAVVSPSRFLRDRLAALGFDGIEVVPNGHARAAVAAPRTVDARGRVRIGFVGAAIPSKGVHVLAEAFRRLDPETATLAIHGPFVPYHGDTTYEARVRAALGPHADAIRGPFDHRDAAAVFAGLDVLVVPSLWEENAPLTVEEAFAAGVPPVVSDHGGLAERVRHDVDGLRFAPGDVDALAAALGRLVAEPGLRARLAAAAPPVVTVEENVAGIDAVYARARERFRARRGRVGVVVLDHAQPEAASRAARSAEDPAVAPEILIVRNGGVPGPREGQGELTLPVNRGYAAGMNAGLRALRAAGCDRVLLLNNDAVLEPGALARLADALDDPTVAAAGPVVLRERDGRVESRGARVDGSWLRPRLIGSGDAHVAREGRLDAASLSGAAWMVRVSALDAVGPLDEGYVHGFEDTDWCWRARQAGLRLVVVLGAVARHAGSRSLGPASPRRLYYAVRAHLRAAGRIGPAAGAVGLGRDACVVAVNAAHALRQSEVPRLAGLAAVLRGARDHARRLEAAAPGSERP